MEAGVRKGWKMWAGQDEQGRSQPLESTPVPSADYRAGVLATHWQTRESRVKITAESPQRD